MLLSLGSCDELDDFSFSFAGAAIDFTLSEQDEPGTYLESLADVETGFSSDLDDAGAASDRVRL